MSKNNRQTPFSAKFKKLLPKKPKNQERRICEYLIETEIDHAARLIGKKSF